MRALAITLFALTMSAGCDDAPTPPPGPSGRLPGDNPGQNPLGCNPDGPCPNGTVTGGATAGTGGSDGSTDSSDAGTSDAAATGGAGGDNGTGGSGGVADAGDVGGASGNGGVGGAVGEGGSAGSGGAGGSADGGAGTGGSGGEGGEGGADGGSPCHRTRGYWLNHPDKWPKDHLTLGTNTYYEDQMLAILSYMTTGNGLVSLSAQLIAAKLNSSAPTDLETQADALIGDLVVPPIGDGYLKPSSTSALTTLLDAYNQAEHCQ